MNPSGSIEQARVRPLLVRPGARFSCLGDGVCCTDLHGVGPLRPTEASMFRAMHPDLVVRFSGHDLLRAGEGGRCPFLGDEGCALHLRLGSTAKPRVCTRFPYGLVATPEGGRITTSLRCSCRTLGDRAPLSVEDAASALSFPSGRLAADQRVSGPIEIRRGHFESFAAYSEREEELRSELDSMPRPLDVIAKRAPGGRGGSSVVRSTRLEQGEALATASLDTRFGAAVAWMGCAMQVDAGARVPQWPIRPWSENFDRAQARTPEPADAGPTAQRILADYAAEALWDLDWVGQLPLAEHLSRLRDQLRTLEILLEALVGLGARPDRAAAEAVMILDLARVEDD